MEIARRGATKTQIVYRANLNFKLASELFVGALKAEYVTLERPARGRPLFKTTTRGLSFLQEILRIDGAVSTHLRTEPTSSDVII